VLALGALLVGGLEAGLRAFSEPATWTFKPGGPEPSRHLPARGQPIWRPVVSEPTPGAPTGWTAQHDELGLRRTGPLSPTPAPGTLRILALGDSWIYGIGVDQPHSVPAVLEELLPTRLGVAEVEVINAGVPSGSAFEMLFWWQRLNETLAFDGVLMGKPHNHARQQMLAPDRSRWLRSYLGAPRAGLRLGALGRWLWASRPWAPASSLGTGDPMMAATDDLVRLATLAQAADQDVWMLFWPTRMAAALAGRRIDERVHQQAMDTLGVPYSGHALAEFACWGSRDSFHPSVRGYRVLAEVAADLIASGRSYATPRDEPLCELQPPVSQPAE